MGKLLAAFKEVLGAQDAARGVEMFVDHAAAISTCMMDLGCMEDVKQKQKKKYMYVATAVAFIEE